LEAARPRWIDVAEDQSLDSAVEDGFARGQAVKILPVDRVNVVIDATSIEMQHTCWSPAELKSHWLAFLSCGLCEL
jgi:hypothetical protein